MVDLFSLVKSGEIPSAVRVCLDVAHPLELKLVAMGLIPFVLFHFVLGGFSSSRKGHVFFGWMAMTGALLGLAMSSGFDALSCVLLSLFALFALRLVGELQNQPMHQRFDRYGWHWVVTSAVVLLGPVVRAKLVPGFSPWIGDVAVLANLFLYPVLLCEMLPVMVRAARGRKEGSIVGISGLVLLIVVQGGYVGLRAWGGPFSGEGLFQGEWLLLGAAGFLMTGSVQLAMKSGRTDLALRERDVELALANQHLEQVRRAADTSDKARGRFLASISHGIRSPLTSILGHAQILRRDAALPESGRISAETIERSALQLKLLIDEVLDFARIEAGRMEVRRTDFDLGTLMESLVAVFRMPCAEKKLSLKMEWDLSETAQKGRWFGEFDSAAATHSADTRPLLPAIPLTGDEGKLSYVLSTLLSNAVKYTERGSIKLRISLFSSTEFSKRPAGSAAESRGQSSTVMNPEPTSQRSPGAVAGVSVISESIDAGGASLVYRFEVIDTGCGISHGAQMRLFEPFRQESGAPRRGGPGLGLALARRHVELMGGLLRVQSELGKGSKFYFDVPLAPAQRGAGQASETREVSCLAAGHSVRALVVDDVRENRDVLAQMLSRIGCSVRMAGSGPEALEMMRAELPSIVFMDIRMPGMWGDEALKRITAEFGERRPAMVALSAFALSQERESYMEAGFNEFLGKPVRLELLCDTLRRLLQVEFDYRDGDAGIRFA